MDPHPSSQKSPQAILEILYQNRPEQTDSNTVQTIWKQNVSTHDSGQHRGRRRRCVKTQHFSIQMHPWESSYNEPHLIFHVRWRRAASWRCECQEDSGPAHQLVSSSHLHIPGKSIMFSSHFSYDWLPPHPLMSRCVMEPQGCTRIMNYNIHCWTLFAAILTFCRYDLFSTVDI